MGFWQSTLVATETIENAKPTVYKRGTRFIVKKAKLLGNCKNALCASHMKSVHLATAKLFIFVFFSLLIRFFYIILTTMRKNVTVKIPITLYKYKAHV